MNAHAYSEDQLVEQPAIGLFGELGWQTVSALEETFGAGGLLGRETKGEVVLVERLRAALVRFNPTLPPEAIQTAIDELTRDRSAMTLEAANREVYRLLKEGITVSVPDREHGGQKTERLRVVDWEHPENNDFVLVSQLTVTGPLYTCRPDLVGFVNGLPWVVIELKKPGVPARAAFDENLTHYKQQIPALFWSNSLFIASNGTDSRVGSLTADWGRWVEWKRIEREDEVLSKLAGNWTFVVVTDRVELDEQIAKTFKTAGAVSEAEGDECHAASGAHLRELLRGNHRYVFTLVHKFQTPELLCDRSDVIVLTDEAHRRPAQGDVPGLYRHPADRRRGAHQGSLRRLRIDLRLPAVHRRRRYRAAVLREPDAGVAARQP